MKSKYLLIVGVAIIAGAIGYALHMPVHATMENDASGTTMHMDQPKRYDVPASEPVPTITLQPFMDSESGWNLRFVTTNFIFDPANVGGDAVPGHGHLHVIVDGTLVGRAYGEWYYLGALKPGKHTITTEMETNDHMDYYANGTQIAASVTVTQTGTDASTAMKDAKTFELVVMNKKLTSGTGDITVTQGDMVTLKVTNDADEELHLHGYNIMTDLKAGVAGTITFQATASGRFPFELEGTKTELGAVLVMPK